jgi:prevent-host-death family protein
MATIPRKGAEEARNQLPSLLEAAEQGRATIITRRGKAVAALIPIEQLNVATKQMSLLPLKGSGRGLWGPDSTKTIKEMRDEWER